MFIDLKRGSKQAFAEISDESHRQAIITWLDDRRDFHKWFASIITGSFIVLTVFGNKPGFESVSQQFLTIALIFLLLSILANLVTLWSIPSWKIMFKINTLSNASIMRRDMRITTWFGVLCFLIGLTLGLVGNMPY